MQTLTNKRILLGVTGGIAAYKAAELLRRLQDQGAEIRVVMTNAATEFITPLTMQALSNNPVHLDLLDTETESVMGHIELARWADLIVIAPASADFIARLATGHGDDLLTTICLAAECKILIAPSMNQAMWAKQATQDNCNLLRDRAMGILGPDEGLQACGETGQGRNRYWKHFFGRGIVDPEDDMRVTNPPSNPEWWWQGCSVSSRPAS